MRMASILEGIYLTHKVNFRFINVLRNILEEENIVKDAYVEEVKLSFNRFVKSVDSAIAIAPEIKRFLEENKTINTNMPKSRTVLLSGSILSAAVFVGSAMLYTANQFVSGIGMISSVAIMVISIFMKDR